MRSRKFRRGEQRRRGGGAARRRSAMPATAVTRRDLRATSPPAMVAGSRRRSSSTTSSTPARQPVPRRGGGGGLGHACFAATRRAPIEHASPFLAEPAAKSPASSTGRGRKHIEAHADVDEKAARGRAALPDDGPRALSARRFGGAWADVRWSDRALARGALTTVPAVAGRVLRFDGAATHAVPRPHDLWFLPFVKSGGRGDEFERSVVLFNTWPADAPPEGIGPSELAAPDDAAALRCNARDAWREVPAREVADAAAPIQGVAPRRRRAAARRAHRHARLRARGARRARRAGARDDGAVSGSEDTVGNAAARDFERIHRATGDSRAPAPRPRAMNLRGPRGDKLSVSRTKCSLFATTRRENPHHRRPPPPHTAGKPTAHQRRTMPGGAHENMKAFRGGHAHHRDARVGGRWSRSSSACRGERCPRCAIAGSGSRRGGSCARRASSRGAAATRAASRSAATCARQAQRRPAGRRGAASA